MSSACDGNAQREANRSLVTHHRSRTKGRLNGCIVDPDVMTDAMATASPGAQVCRRTERGTARTRSSAYARRLQLVNEIADGKVGVVAAFVI
jgi:hypothetical protein